MTIHPFRRLPHRAAHAFTLVELAVVMIIIGIVTAIAVPRYTGFVAGQRADTAARRITTDLAFVQRRARVSSQSRTISFLVPQDKYEVPGVPDPDHADRDYSVSLGQEPYNAIIVSADFGGDADLVFDGYGVADTDGSVVIRVGIHQRTITVESGSSVTPEIPVKKDMFLE